MTTLIPELDDAIDTVVLEELEFSPGCQLCHFMPFFKLDIQCQREAEWVVLLTDEHPCCGIKRRAVEVFLCDACYQNSLQDTYPASHQYDKCGDTYKISEVMIMADRIHG